jgi:hypothetical protein
MNIITNDSMIKRNARIAQIAMIAGLIVLAGGMVVSFSPNYARYFYLSLLALVFGFILSQVGIYFTNHFGRHPRPDEQLNQALKGLDGKYTLYHYMTPVPHLLVGPSGIWLLMVRSQKGRITYIKDRWKQSGGNLYLKIFAQESLGRPDIDLTAEMEKISEYLKKNIPDGETLKIQAALVFTNPAVKIEIPEDVEPPAVTVTADKLKEVIRKTAKSKPISQSTIQQILDVLPAESK